MISCFESCDRFRSRNFKTKLLIESDVENGVENGIEEDSRLENSSLLGHDWGDEARGQLELIISIAVLIAFLGGVI